MEKDNDNATQLKAPNGMPSNLNEEQWNFVRSDEFKDWFGDWENDPEESSVTLDENGEPKIFHHATNAVFDNFDERYMQTGNDAGWLGRGFYFYGDESECFGYGKYEHNVFLNIRQPYLAMAEEMDRLSELSDLKKYPVGLPKNLKKKTMTEFIITVTLEKKQ